ncbi:MFS transporter [Gordonia rhizosphera]|uniref:Putative drug resistance protein n=1 Tax=Gordonia rhizosphera NBRC 16068 TaxID=1108045 RepID=K6VTB0_9ACTN|nr:MFS transporter [Gordonia rhizosphera]GAB90150.1 putative drug resistance protein [Gordonia rhizosphera NBRC 16068]
MSETQVLQPSPPDDTLEERVIVDHSRRRWWALGVIALAQLMVVLDATIVTIALPFAQVDLQISDANRQWAMTAYTLIFGGLLLLGGRLADYLGRRRMLLIGLIGFAASSAVAGLAWNSVSFFGGRALQGAFAAILAPAALSLITVTFIEQKERARAFAVYAAVSGGGAAIGLIAGGALTEYVSWRMTLLVNTPIAAIAAVGAIALVTHDRPSVRRRGYDIPGAITATIGLISLVYGFTRAAEVGWSSASTVSLFVLAAALLVAFVYIEARSANPLLPLRIPGDLNRGGAFLLSLIIPIPMFAVFMFLSYYLQNTLGYTPLGAGVAFLPFPAAIIVAAGISSSLLPRVGPRIPTIAGSALGVAGLLYLAQLDSDSTWLGTVLPSQVLIAGGMGFIFVAMQSVALHRIEERDAGVASALLNTGQQIGGSVGLALLSTIVAQVFARHPGSAMTVDPATGHPVPVDATAFKAASIYSYDVAFYWGAGFFVLALLVALSMIRLRASDMGDETQNAVHVAA